MPLPRASAASQASPRSTSGRSTTISPRTTADGPGQRLLEEVGGLEHRVGDAEVEGLLGPAASGSGSCAFSTMTVTALSAPIRFGSSWLPPQPGTRPRKTSGNATAGTPDGHRAVVRVQGQLQAAAHGGAVDEGEGRDRRVAQLAERVVARARSRSCAWAGVPPACITLRSAPTAKMNGLPVTATATTSSRPSASSMAAPMLAQARRAERRRLGVVEAVVDA